MKKSTKIAAIVLIIAVLLIAVGYAVITAVELKITGTAESIAKQENFKVAFSGDPVVSDDTKVEASISSEVESGPMILGDLNVTGLSYKGETVSATYTIKNESEDLSAVLTALVKDPTNTDYFDVKYQFGDTPDTLTETITKGTSTTLKVSVTLLKTPVLDTENLTGSFNVIVTAEPKQP